PERRRRVEAGRVRAAWPDGGARARARRDARSDPRGTAPPRFRRARPARARDRARGVAIGGRGPDGRDRRAGSGSAAVSIGLRLAIGLAVVIAAGVGIATAHRADGFVVTRLASDAQDARLVNAWGLA